MNEFPQQKRQYNACFVVNNEFWSRVMRFGNDFHEGRSHYTWKDGLYIEMTDHVVYVIVVKRCWISTSVDCIDQPTFIMLPGAPLPAPAMSQVDIIAPKH